MIPTLRKRLRAAAGATAIQVARAGRTLGLWGALGGLLAGCDDRPLALVSVSPLPQDAAQLYVSLTYRSRPARAPAPIQFDLSGHARDIPATFGVRLPDRTNGELVVGAGVLDRSGCLSAVGGGATRMVLQSPTVDVPLSLIVPDALTPSERCDQPQDTPLVLGVSPARVSSRGGQRVTLSGWGFDTDPCALVSINANPATEILCTSLVELTATVPPSGGTVGPVPVQVLNRNGRRAVQSGLFSYFAADLRLGRSTTYPVGAAPSALAAGAIDGDTRPDLIVANRDDGTITVLVNSGQGDFPNPLRVTVPVGVRPRALALGDLNGDGAADVLTANSGDHTVSVLLQTRPAQAVAFSPGRPVFVNLLPSALATGDLDGDGGLDAVVANQLSSDVSVLLNSRSGRLSKSPQRDYPVQREPTAVALADVDRDGDLDLLVRSDSETRLVVLKNVAGGYPMSEQISVALPVAATAMAVEDLDGNGAPDVILAGSDGAVRVLWNDGHGKLDAPEAQSVRVASGLTALAVGDLDRDGRADAVVSTASEQRIYILRNTLTLTGQRGLELVDGGYLVGSRPVAVAIADFDGDLMPDVAVASQDAGTVTVLLNQSS